MNQDNTLCIDQGSYTEKILGIDRQTKRLNECWKWKIMEWMVLLEVEVNEMDGFPGSGREWNRWFCWY